MNDSYCWRYPRKRICWAVSYTHLSDLRPVFPEERLLLELLLEKQPYEFIEKSVWAVNLSLIHIYCSVTKATTRSCMRSKYSMVAGTPMTMPVRRTG